MHNFFFRFVIKKMPYIKYHKVKSLTLPLQRWKSCDAFFLNESIKYFIYEKPWSYLKKVVYLFHQQFFMSRVNYPCLLFIWLPFLTIAKSSKISYTLDYIDETYRPLYLVCHVLPMLKSSSIKFNLILNLASFPILLPTN